MRITVASTGERPLGELTEATLADWLAGLSAEMRGSELKIMCGSPMVELVARRIVDSPPLAGESPLPLYGKFAVCGEPAMAWRAWKAMAIL